MKLARYETGPNRFSFGILEGDMSKDLQTQFGTFAECIGSAEKIINEKHEMQKARISYSALAPPVEPSSKILCVAANYYSHIKEMGMTPPREPVVFSKFYTSLVGPYAPINSPDISNFIDYEGELAVVIGKTGRNISMADAMRYVAGFTVINDVSARDLLRVTLGSNTIFDWFSCKAIDGTTPIGPWVVTKDEIADPRKLRIVTRLNGEVVQDETTAGMVFPIEALIEYISKRVTLNPGDIIATGTPSGVGVARKRNLVRGDVVRVEIDGVGYIENRIV